jgi:hypothetical protein
VFHYAESCSAVLSWNYNLKIPLPPIQYMYADKSWPGVGGISSHNISLVTSVPCYSSEVGHQFCSVPYIPVVASYRRLLDNSLLCCTFSIWPL